MEMTNPKRTTPSKRLRQGLLPALLKRIVEGELKPGAKIIESRLAAEIGVSRTPLREALLYLEREGLVRSDLRRGFTVAALSAREVRETYPLLAALECFAVRQRPQLLKLLIPDLERINGEFARARSPQRALDLDTLWHDKLMSQSMNSRLIALVASLRRAIRRYEHFYMSEARLIPASAAQHRAIIHAIRKGDTDEVLRAIDANYLFGMQVLLQKMGEE